MESGHAHRTGLAGRGHNRSFEQDVARVQAGLADGVYLGVGRDIGRQHDGIMRAGQQFAVAGDGTAKRTLPGRQPLAAFLDRQLH
jgi:hypothetical protein